MFQIGGVLKWSPSDKLIIWVSFCQKKNQMQITFCKTDYSFLESQLLYDGVKHVLVHALYIVPFDNSRTLKSKTQLKITFFTAVNHNYDDNQDIYQSQSTDVSCWTSVSWVVRYDSSEKYKRWLNIVYIVLSL